VTFRQWLAKRREKRQPPPASDEMISAILKKLGKPKPTPRPE
jgi:hypothetical protein